MPANLHLRPDVNAFLGEISKYPDSRPRCVLVVGDGISRSFVSHLRLENEIVTSSLFPPAKNVRYFSDPIDRFNGNMWLGDRSIFPRLWDYWEAWCRLNVTKATSKNAFIHFCEDNEEQIATGSAKPPFQTGRHPSGYRISIDFASLGYQLRCYLWKLFCSYDRVLRNGALLGGIDWSWNAVLDSLISWTHLTLISFNYDVVAEAITDRIAASGGRPTQVVHPMSRCMEFVNVRSSRCVEVLKPHGSIDCTSVSALQMTNPWNGTNKVSDLVIDHFSSAVYPPGPFPIYPDIVPPGQGLRQRANPEIDVVPAIELAMADASMVILCGLSAGPPDTKEIATYFDSLRPDIPCLHIGLSGDQNNAASVILKSATSKYTFLEASRVPTIPYWIVANLPKS